MTDVMTPASGDGSIRDNAVPIKPAIALGLAALADWLFYGQRVGISAVIFAVALICGSLLANFTRLNSKHLLLAGILAIAGLLPALEEFNTLSLALLLLAFGLGLRLATYRTLDGLTRPFATLRDLYLFGPFRFIREVAGTFNLPALTTGFALWFVPIIIGGVFASLFVLANPLLEKWTSLVAGDIASYVSIERTLFWTCVLSAVWPFIHVRWRTRPTPAEDAVDMPAQEQAPSFEGPNLFGVATILRSLILFNLLFAAQTGLDAIYLWGNARLPVDISYAAYAHRGAYPLILTALLAAGFVLAAMKPGGPGEQSKVIRPLVYLFVAQNVLLVASSILRLDLYVQLYLLTYWRVAAFIWMLLVALGLLLIVARIALNRSNAWLIHANLITLTATLYICSLVNLAAVIADYNVSHSREASGKGVALDMNYLVSLGPQALPAIGKAMKLRGFDPNLVCRRDSLVEQQRQDMASWRAWGFRSWRLQRALDAQQKSSTAG